MGVVTGIFSTRAIAVPKTRLQRVRSRHPAGYGEFILSVTIELVDVPRERSLARKISRANEILPNGNEIR